jgi:hypothetical protein
MISLRDAVQNFDTIELPLIPLDSKVFITTSNVTTTNGGSTRVNTMQMITNQRILSKVHIQNFDNNRESANTMMHIWKAKVTSSRMIFFYLLINNKLLT